MLRSQIKGTQETSSDQAIIRKLYRWSFAIRFIVGLTAYLLTMFTDIELLQDALYYEQIGYSVASDWLDGRESAWLGEAAEQGRRPLLLILMVAGFYYVTAGLRLVPLLLALYSAITAIIPVYIFRLARELGASDTAARRAGWLVALSPSFVFWSGSLYKEGLIFLILSVGSYYVLKLQTQWRVSWLLIVLGCVFGLLSVRFYLAAIMSVGVALGLLIGRGRRTSTGSPVAPVAALVRQSAIVVAFLALLMMAGFAERVERPLAETDRGFLVQLDTSRTDLARSTSGYLREETVATPQDALQYTPVGLAYFLTVPLPWQLGGIRQNFAIPETLFWIALYPFIVLGVRRGLKENRSGTLYVIVLSGAMCVLYALLCSNIGVAYRMRSQIWLLWAPFAMWGYETWAARRKQRSGQQPDGTTAVPQGSR